MDIRRPTQHKGFKNLLLGIHGHYRNPRAHATRLGASEDIADFYDAFDARLLLIPSAVASSMWNETLVPAGRHRERR